MSRPSGWDLRDAVHELRAFRDAREWRQFHTPKDLASALAIEAGELQQLFLWKTAEEIEALAGDAAFRASVADELADVLSFALYLADRLDLDPAEAIRSKLERNESRYPADRHRGVADRAQRRDG